MLSSADHMMVGRGRVGACGPTGLIHGVLVRSTLQD